jgi:hypothetical protein
MSEKTEHSLQLKPRQWKYLQEMVKKYQLSDESKALRCLIDSALSNPAAETAIFTEIRCLDC